MSGKSLTSKLTMTRSSAAAFSVEFSVYGTVSCAHLTYGGKTTAEAGTPLPIATEGVAPSECKGASAVSNVAVSTPASTLTATGGGDGTWTVGSSSSHFQVSFDVTALGTVYHCVFGTASASLQYDYSAGLVQGKVSLARESEGQGKAFCGSAVTMNLTAFEEEMYVSRL